MKIIDFKTKSNSLPSNRKGKFVCAFTGLIADKNKIKEVVKANFYEGKTNTYCYLHIKHQDKDIFLSSKTNCIGIEPISVSFSLAVDNIIKFNDRINGVGKNKVEEAIMAILEYLYPDDTITKDIITINN